MEHQDGLATLRGDQYAKAVSLLAKALARAEKENPSPLLMGRMRNNHASALYQAGDYDAAEAGFQEALRCWKQTPEAPAQERARTHNNLAVLYRQRWNLDEAARHARKALELDQAALFLHTLGEILRMQGRYKESLRVLRAAEEAGPDPVELGTILQARAGVALDQGLPAEAEPLFRKAIAELRIVCGDSHPALLAAKGNLGVALTALRRFTEAEPLLASVYRDARSALGENHPRVAAAANNMARGLREQKRYREADDMYREALSIWRQVFGPRHPEYAKGLHNLASLFVEQGKLHGAEKLYAEALRIAEANFGKQHAQTRLHLSGLEQVYRLQKRSTELARLQRVFR